MVHLQIDLSTVTTKATMAEALRFALNRNSGANPGILKVPFAKEQTPYRCERVST
jgi:hypothetical protein